MTARAASDFFMDAAWVGCIVLLGAATFLLAIIRVRGFSGLE